MKKIFFCLSILLFVQTVFAGGGWPQPKKSGYIKLNQWIVIADQYYTPAGDIIPIRTTGLYTSSIYLEYGLTDRLTGILYFPFFSRSTLNKQVLADGTLLDEGDELNGVGDTDLTFKYGLITDQPI
ncbi:MAG: hypothetical protein R3345_09480, partial [Fulvivirga sp.]|nr:hypothetical protein [Fulvivirga sp.]